MVGYHHTKSFRVHKLFRICAEVSVYTAKDFVKGKPLEYTTCKSEGGAGMRKLSQVDSICTYIGTPDGSNVVEYVKIAIAKHF